MLLQLRILALTYLAVLVSAERYVLQSGKEYHYDYTTQVTSDFEGVGNQKAIVGIKAKLIFQGYEDGVILQLKDLKYAHSPDLKFTRETPTTEIPLQYYSNPAAAPDIEKPIKLIYYHNITGIDFDSNENNFEYNFKLAVASLVNLNLDRNILLRDKPEVVIQTEFNEETLHGKCFVNYIYQDRLSAAHPKVKTFDVTKTVNYATCEDGAFHKWSSLGEYSCSTCGNNMDIITGDGSIDYTISDLDGDYVIEHASGFGQIIIQLFSMYGDKLKSHAFQNLDLTWHGPIGKRITLSTSRPFHVEGFPYRLEKEFLEQSKGKLQPTSAPYTKTNLGLKQRPPPEKIAEASFSAQKINSVIALLDEVALALHDVQSIPEKDIVSRAAFAGSILYETTEAELQAIFGKIEKQETKRRLFIDVVTFSGSQTSISFLVKLIKQKVLVGEDAIRALPTYTFDLNEALIQELWDLWKSGTAQETRELYTQSLLSFAVLYRQICILRPAVVHARGIQCSGLQRRKYLEEIIRRFETTKETWEKIATLVALRTMSVPETFEFLVPYLTQGYQKLKPVVRAELLKSLWTVAQVHSKEIVELVLPIYLNTNLTPLERISAYYLIMYTEPPEWVYRRIAISTWNEQSENVAGIVYQTLRQMSNATMICGRKEAVKARAALPYARVVDEKASISSSWMNTAFSDDTKAGLFQWLSVTANPDSLIPNLIYLTQGNELSGYYYDTFQFSLFLNGWQQSLEDLLGVDSHAIRNSKQNDILKQKNTTPRTEKDFFNYYNLELFGNRIKLGFLDKAIPNGFLRIVDGESLLSQLQKGIPINYYKFLSAGDYAIHFPSTAGISMMMTIAMPALIDVKGKISLDTKSTKGIELKVDIVPTIAVKMQAATGFIIPFLQVLTLSGVEGHLFLSPPISFKAEIPKELPLTNWKASLYRPKIARQYYKILKADIIPYTSFWNMTTTFTLSNQWKVVETMKKPYKFEHTVGRQFLGIPTIIKGGSEILWQKHESIWDSILEHGVFTVLGNFWVNPRFKRQQYEILVDVQHADTDQVQLEFSAERRKTVLEHDPNIHRSVIEYLFGWNRFPGSVCKLDSSQSPITTTSSPDATTTKKPGWFSSITRPIIGGYKKLKEKIQGKSDTEKEHTQVTQPPTTTTEKPRRVPTPFPPFPRRKYDDDEIPSYNRDPVYPSQSYTRTTPSYVYQPDQHYDQRRGHEQHHTDDVFPNPNYNSGHDDYSQKSGGFEDEQISQSHVHDPFGQHSGQESGKEDPFGVGTDEYGRPIWPAEPQKEDPLKPDRYNDRQPDILISTYKKLPEDTPTKYTLRISTIGRQQRKIIIESTEIKKLNPPSYEVSTTVDLHNLPAFNGGNYKICINGDIKYGEVMCATEDAPKSVRDDEKVKLNFHFTWGKNCESSNFFKLKSIYEKSEEQLQVLQTLKSNECKNEYERDSLTSADCRKFYSEQRALRKLTFVLEHQNIPAIFVNASHSIDHYFQCLLHKHLSNNAINVKNYDGRTTAILTFHATDAAVDIQVFKPYENTFYTDVYYPNYIPSYQVPAIGTTLDKKFKQIFGKYFKKCQVTKSGDVLTFNQLTYNYAFDDCSYIIAQDCTNGLFQVALTPNTDSAVPAAQVAISILDDIIFILPPTKGYPAKIKVDKEYQLEGQFLVVSKKSSKVIALVVQSGSDVILSSDWKFEVTISEAKITVKVSPLWIGRVCGLCGEYNNEKRKTYYTANKCLHTNTTHFAESYSFERKERCSARVVHECTPGSPNIY